MHIYRSHHDNACSAFEMVGGLSLVFVLTSGVHNEKEIGIARNRSLGLIAHLGHCIRKGTWMLMQPPYVHTLFLALVLQGAWFISKRKFPCFEKGWTSLSLYPHYVKVTIYLCFNDPVKLKFGCFKVRKKKNVIGYEEERWGMTGLYSRG
jgi:hypothetical protein